MNTGIVLDGLFDGLGEALKTVIQRPPFAVTRDWYPDDHGDGLGYDEVIELDDLAGRENVGHGLLLTVGFERRAPAPYDAGAMIDVT